MFITYSTTYHCLGNHSGQLLDFYSNLSLALFTCTLTCQSSSLLLLICQCFMGMRRCKQLFNRFITISVAIQEFMRSQKRHYMISQQNLRNVHLRKESYMIYCRADKMEPQERFHTVQVVYMLTCHIERMPAQAEMIDEVGKIELGVVLIDSTKCIIFLESYKRW